MKPTQIHNCNDAMVEILRGKTEAERLEISFGMWRSAKQLIEACIRSEHPELSDDEVLRQVARRMSRGAV